MADPQPDQPVHQDSTAPTTGQPSAPTVPEPVVAASLIPSSPEPALSDIDPILGPSSNPTTAPATPTTEELKPWPTSPAVPISPAAPPLIPPTKPWWKRLWLVWLSLIVVAMLAVILWFVYKNFTSTVTSDHAEHQMQSPSVHHIVHVRQKLLVGTEDTFKPMEFIDPETNQLSGFDIDLSKAIAKELNVPVEFVKFDFSSVFEPANLGSQNVLTKGDVDMIIDSVSITDLRKQHYAFSSPYLNAGQVAIVLNSNTSVNVGDDLKGKRITVGPSTTNETLALTYTSTDKVLRYKDSVDQAKAVMQGKADAMLVDLTNAKGIIETYPSFKIATDPLTSDYYGVVIDQDKADLVEQVDQILDSLKQRGVLESLKQKWLE